MKKTNSARPKKEQDRIKGLRTRCKSEMLICILYILIGVGINEEQFEEDIGNLLENL